MRENLDGGGARWELLARVQLRDARFRYKSHLAYFLKAKSIREIRFSLWFLWLEVSLIELDTLLRNALSNIVIGRLKFGMF